MGTSASKIWSDICALESDALRAQMIQTVMHSPDIVAQAKVAGLYGGVIMWLTAYRQGGNMPFPYATQRDTIQHEEPRWSMYTTPVQQKYTPSSTALTVTQTAKADDYFYEALDLLGIPDNVAITAERLRSAYKKASLRAHPDKGGSKEAFDAVQHAYRYVEKIVNRVGGQVEKSVVAEEEKPQIQAAAPVKLSAKKLDMATFNRVFEENRMADPERDRGYGSWLKSNDGVGAIGADPRLQGKFSQETFESVFRERAATAPKSKGSGGPAPLVAAGMTEIGGELNSFTAGFGSDTQFTDLMEAYTTGATMYQDVADVRVTDRKYKSAEEFSAARAAELKRVDPAEAARFQAEVEAEAERERQRAARATQQDTAMESWASALRSRLSIQTD
jgi:hypothetical protein